MDGCEALARTVLESDGYPPVVPQNLRGFIESPEALSAFVATGDGQVVGHVCVNPTSSREVMALAAHELSVAPERLAVVARLVVSPDRRGPGSAAPCSMPRSIACLSWTDG